jgi:GAF domain-containing protein
MDPRDSAHPATPPVPPAERQLARIMAELREQLASARATLRLDVPGEQPLPMTHESLAPGVASVQGRVVPAHGSPTVTKLLRDRSVVVVEDCRLAARNDPDFDDDGFRAMISDYGGLGAFVAAPLFDGSRLVGIISVHHLGSPRAWNAEELELVQGALERVAALRTEFAAEAENR